MVVPGLWNELHGEVHKVSERSDIEMQQTYISFVLVGRYWLIIVSHTTIFCAM